MNSCLPLAETRPDLHSVGWLELHLGTRVSISCRARSLAAGREAVRAAFAEVEQVHRLMSFHQKDSDVSRLNRLAAREPVTVDPGTVEVLRAAGEVSRLSAGHFDCTTAAELVGAGHLPRPASTLAPDPEATWRDVELVSEDAVSFRRPLWLDLGGIAKGYAVDRAFRTCVSGDVQACMVNAGGDVRVSDGLTASIALDVPREVAREAAAIELSDGSLASSCGLPEARMHAGEMTGPHYDGSTRAPVDPRRFVSVLAPDCMFADALTKVVLVLGEAAAGALARYGATAFVCSRQRGWEQIPNNGVTTMNNNGVRLN